MVFNRFLISALVGIIFISAIYSYGLNTCGIVGDRMPAGINDCVSDKNLTMGSKCCYISAIPLNDKISACFLLPPGANITIIQQAAEALGRNSTSTCEDSNQDKKDDKKEDSKEEKKIDNNLITNVVMIYSFVILSFLIVLVTHK